MSLGSLKLEKILRLLRGDSWELYPPNTDIKTQIKGKCGIGDHGGEPVDESSRASCIVVGTLGIWRRSKGSAGLSGKSHSPADHMIGGGGSTSLEAKHPGLEQPWKHWIPLARIFFTMDSAGTMNIALKVV